MFVDTLGCTNDADTASASLSIRVIIPPPPDTARPEHESFITENMLWVEVADNYRDKFSPGA